jgi:cyanophycin synthetase
MGDVVYLKSTANLSTGRTSVDNRYAASWIFYENFESNWIDICGVDIMAENLTQP